MNIEKKYVAIFMTSFINIRTFDDDLCTKEVYKV